MGAELARERQGKQTRTGMSESQLEDFASKPVKSDNAPQEESAPEGHDEWLKHFEYAIRHNPHIRAMASHHMEFLRSKGQGETEYANPVGKPAATPVHPALAKWDAILAGWPESKLQQGATAAGFGLGVRHATGAPLPKQQASLAQMALMGKHLDQIANERAAFAGKQLSTTEPMLASKFTGQNLRASPLKGGARVSKKQVAANNDLIKNAFASGAKRAHDLSDPSVVGAQELAIPIRGPLLGTEE